MQQKSWLGGHFFQNSGSRGSGRIRPGGLKYHIKASVTLMAFGREKSNHTLARCVFFYQHCFTKIIDTKCCDEKYDKHHW